MSDWEVWEDHLQAIAQEHDEAEERQYQEDIAFAQAMDEQS